MPSDVHAAARKWPHGSHDAQRLNRRDVCVRPVAAPWPREAERGMVTCPATQRGTISEVSARGPLQHRGRAKRREARRHVRAPGQLEQRVFVLRLYGWARGPMVLSVGQPVRVEAKPIAFCRLFPIVIRFRCLSDEPFDGLQCLHVCTKQNGYRALLR